jgi:hypothetical protein
MTQYAEYTRHAADVAVAGASSRFSITRRPAFDLPLAASGGGADAALPRPNAPDVETPAPQIAEVADPDFDLSSTFDVPAFLRRQEG